MGAYFESDEFRALLRALIDLNIPDSPAFLGSNLKSSGWKTCRTSDIQTRQSLFECSSKFSSILGWTSWPRLVKVVVYSYVSLCYEHSSGPSHLQPPVSVYFRGFSTAGNLSKQHIFPVSICNIYNSLLTLQRICRWCLLLSFCEVNRSIS